MIDTEITGATPEGAPAGPVYHPRDKRESQGMLVDMSMRALCEGPRSATSTCGRFAATLAAVVAWCGCSSPVQEDPSPAICTGDPSVRLVFQVSGGGQVLPGSQVLSENGFQFLLVEGSCRAWMLTDRGSEIRTVQLAASDAELLARQLQVAEWGSLQGQYTRDLCDGPGWLLRFDRTRIALGSSCGGRDDSARVRGLEVAARDALAARYAAGAAIDGAVRFVLVAEAPDVVWPPLVASAAAPWPLATAPDTLAISILAAQDYQPGSSRSVTQPEADQLRALRRNFAARGGPALSGGFIPVTGAGGSRYQLFVRDSIPLEDTRGLLHVD